jgi:hypothetical protein
MESFSKNQLMRSLDSCHLMYGSGMTKKQLLRHIRLLHESNDYYNIFFNKQSQMNYFKSL